MSIHLECNRPKWHHFGTLQNDAVLDIKKKKKQKKRPEACLPLVEEGEEAGVYISIIDRKNKKRGPTRRGIRVVYISISQERRGKRRRRKSWCYARQWDWRRRTLWWQPSATLHSRACFGVVPPDLCLIWGHKAFYDEFWPIFSGERQRSVTTRDGPVAACVEVHRLLVVVRIES